MSFGNRHVMFGLKKKCNPHLVLI